MIHSFQCNKDVEWDNEQWAQVFNQVSANRNIWSRTLDRVFSVIRLTVYIDGGSHLKHLIYIHVYFLSFFLGDFGKKKHHIIRSNSACTSCLRLSCPNSFWLQILLHPPNWVHFSFIMRPQHKQTPAPRDDMWGRDRLKAKQKRKTGDCLLHCTCSLLCLTGYRKPNESPPALSLLLPNSDLCHIWKGRGKERAWEERWINK